MKIYVLDLKNKGRFIEFYVNISDTGRLPQKKIVPIGMTATQLKGGNCVLDGLQCIQLLGRSATQSPQQCKGVLDHPPPPPSPNQGRILPSGMFIRSLFSLVLKVLSLEVLITSFRRIFPPIIGNMSLREIH